MNNSVQDWAVGDRRVHSELSGVVVCSALTMVYHCIITHQITTRSIARVTQRVLRNTGDFCYETASHGVIYQQ